MKKLLIALIVATLATPAVAMPEAVPDTWYGRMMSRLQTMAENPGFCRAHNTTWICDYWN